jgi:hypothetical protein
MLHQQWHQRNCLLVLVLRGVLLLLEQEWKRWEAVLFEEWRQKQQQHFVVRIVLRCYIANEARQRAAIDEQLGMQSERVSE